MDETQALIPVQDTGLKTYDEKVFDSLAAGNFLPRIQVCDSNSDIAKKKKAAMGNIAFVRGQEVIDLGESADFVVVGWQPKAMKFGDEIITSTDPESPTFKKIQVDSQQPNSGCMWGFDFLVYLRDLNEFASYFMGSATARREAPSLKKLMGQRATLKSHFIEKGKYSWYGPVIVPCSTPFETLPDEIKIKEAVAKFQKVQEVEIVEEAADTRER